MANFDGILRKALASRPEADESQRQYIYDRARSAIIAQLKAIDPPLSAEQISSQKLALEAAIRSIEQDYQTPESEHSDEVSDEKDLETAPQAEEEAAGGVQKAVREDPGKADVTPSLKVSEDSPATASHIFARAAQGSSSSVSSASEGSSAHSSKEATNASADRNAKLSQGQTASSHDEPSPALAKALKHHAHFDSAKPLHVERQGFGIGAKSLILLVLLLLVGGTGYAVVESGLLTASDRDTLAQRAEAPANPLPLTASGNGAQGSSEQPVKSADRLLPNLQGEERNAPVPLQQTLSGQDPVAQENTDNSSDQPSASNNETAQGTPSSDSSQEVLPVAQTALLYEAATEPGQQGTRADGGVVWTLDQADSNNPVIRGMITVPGRNLEVALSISKNQDDSLPASHLMEFRFDNPDELPGGGISAFAGVVMKTQEEARGDPLRGATAKVQDNLFWQALSAQEDLQQINMALLQQRGWFDVLILFNGNRRAILTLEKGPPGEKVFQDALQAWQ
jgi:hypothetical protein